MALATGDGDWFDQGLAPAGVPALLDPWGHKLPYQALQGGVQGVHEEVHGEGYIGVLGEESPGFQGDEGDGDWLNQELAPERVPVFLDPWGHELPHQVFQDGVQGVHGGVQSKDYFGVHGEVNTGPMSAFLAEHPFFDELEYQAHLK